MQVREVYERAVGNVPPAPAKRYWQRYIYLWLKYALWEELEAQDATRAREVYRACLKVIPHGAFTFAKARPRRAQHRRNAGKSHGIMLSGLSGPGGRSACNSAFNLFQWWETLPVRSHAVLVYAQMRSCMCICCTSRPAQLTSV